MLLGDFQTYISSEIHKDTKHVKVSEISKIVSVSVIYKRYKFYVQWAFKYRGGWKTELGKPNTIPIPNVLKVKICIQSGLENRTQKTERHPNSEHFKSR